MDIWQYGMAGIRDDGNVSTVSTLQQCQVSNIPDISFMLMIVGSLMQVQQTGLILKLRLNH